MTFNTLWGTVLDGWNGHLFISVYSVNPGVPMEAVWVISRSDRDRAASLPVHSRSIWHTITSMTQTSRQVQQEPLTVSVDDCRIRVQTGEPIIFVDARGRRTGLPAPRRSPGPCALIRRHLPYIYLVPSTTTLWSTVPEWIRQPAPVWCNSYAGKDTRQWSFYVAGSMPGSARMACCAQRRLSEIEKAWASDEQLATV